MKKKIVLFVLTAFLFIAGCSQMEDQKITAPEKSDAAVMPDGISGGDLQIQMQISKLDILARNLAFALNNEAALNSLSSETRKADNKERIIDLSKWLNKDVAGSTLAQRMALSGNMEQIDGRQRQVTAEDFTMITQSLEPMVDVYFPVDEHRNNWYENKDKLLIAVVHPAKEWEPATAYKLNGEKVLLDPYTPPEEPVLVVSLCEHSGVHYGKLNNPNNKTTPPDDGGGGGWGGGGSHGPRVNGNWEILHQILLHDDGEGWLLGDPEIYFVTASHDFGELTTEWLPEVNDEEVLYTVDRYMFHWYWNEYGTSYRLKVAEADDWDYSISILGQRVSINITNDDEDLGSKIVNKDDPYNEKYETGMAYFRITYID